jgi:hypothetical protein
MAVLVEGISVVMRIKTIENLYPGGWTAFCSQVPNSTLCYDDEIVRIGFMTPQDVETFIEHLEKNGFVFQIDGKAKDIAVMDQFQGSTMPCDWLEFARLNYGNDGKTENPPIDDKGGYCKISACWLFDGPRDRGAGIYFKSMSMGIATPVGWEYEGSLSQTAIFVPDEELDERFKYLRAEDGVDVYLDLCSGKEVYVGRSDTSSKRRH